MVIYFITGNKNKFEEIKKILPNIKQLDIDLIEIQEVDSKKIIEAKLIEAQKYKKGEFIVEDTSLHLECINNLPGPLIKWFVKELGAEGIYNLVKKYKNNKAKARTLIGYSNNKNKIYFFEGIIKGKIVEPKGKSGFAWDFIFQPNGYNKTFAEMTKDEKNKISMRSIAINKLKNFLEKNN